MLIEPQFGAGTRKGCKYKNSVDLKQYYLMHWEEDDHGYEKPTWFNSKKA